MSIRARGLRVAAAVALFAILALCAGIALAESADPIRVSSLSDPQSVIDEQDVEITIKIYNSSQADMTDEITLFGPDGVSVDKYAGLAGEQSVTYTGKWHVTADEIDRGRINYYIQYFVNSGDGPKQMTRTIPVTIQTEAAAPQLSATYSITPAAAREGQQVTLSYTLSNTGNVELRNIVIANKGVTQNDLTVASLSPGERITQESTITMGKEELVSNPTVTYQAADSDKTLTISDMARKTITLAEDGLDVTLSAKTTQDLYPGERVQMTVTMKNTGETAYSGLNISLSGGEPVASGVELAPGASFEQTFEYTAVSGGAVSLYVEGADATGETVAVVSNELALTTQDASQALILNVRAQVENNVMFSEPGVLRFAVVVENTGETDATSLSVTQNGTQVATIPSLPSGENRTLVFDLMASIAGQFQFVVSGRDGKGNERSFQSNILQVTYQAPTPEPTLEPTPSPVPPTPSPVPTATPKPSVGERISGALSGINPLVLYTVAGVLIAALAAIVAVSCAVTLRRKSLLAKAIDTIERSPDVRDHRGVRRKSAQKASSGKGRSGGDEPIVPTPELTDDYRPFSGYERQQALEREEGDRLREELEKSLAAEQTLRVAPVDQRPDFVAQGKVDDSETRVFSGLRAEEQASGETKVIPEVKPPKEEPAAQAPSAEGGETIRMSRVQAEPARRQPPQKEHNTIKNAKPMKKKRKGLFGGDDGDDLIEDDDSVDFSDSDDDFTE